MIVIDRLTTLLRDGSEMIRSLAETNGGGRADAGAGRRFAATTSVSTQVAFHRMMIDRIETHRTVRTGRDAFAASSAPVFVHSNDTGFRILMDRLRVDRTGPQTGGPFAMLAADGQEIDIRRTRRFQPKHLVTVFVWSQPVLLLARRLTALAADTAGHVYHQGNTAHGPPKAARCHQVIGLPPAT